VTEFSFAVSFCAFECCDEINLTWLLRVAKFWTFCKNLGYCSLSLAFDPINMIAKLLQIGLRFTLLQRTSIFSPSRWPNGVQRVLEVESLFPKGRPNVTQRCKRFATASTSINASSCVALALLWRRDGNRKLVSRRNTASYNERFGLGLFFIFAEKLIWFPT